MKNRLDVGVVVALCLVCFALGLFFAFVLGANFEGRYTNQKSESVKHETLIGFGCGEYHSKTGEFVLIRNNEVK